MHNAMSRRLSAVRACAAFASVWLAAPLAAQTGMPFDIESKLAELRALVNLSEPGKIFAPLQDRLYARLQEKEPYKGIKVTRDVKYGPDERNALDVFAAEQPASGPRPVLMFVHGGGFVGGSRRIPGSPFYDNVMLFAARNGMVGICNS